MLIKIEEIKKICNSLIAKLEQVEDYELDLNFTSYWTVPFKSGQKLFAPVVNAVDFRDVLKELKKRSDIKSSISDTEFEYLGDLFRALGLKLEKLNEGKNRDK